MTRFDHDTTTDELLEGRDLTGTTVAVTGVSAGLGVETCRVLAAHGARVLGLARDRSKADVALAAAGATSVEVTTCDLASQRSVRECADDLMRRLDRLDVLVANAGVMACPEGRTVDGHEIHFATNHLGHFTLVNRLVPLLVAAAPSRVVVVSSAGHHLADVDLDDPNFERSPYDPWVAYGRSKSANALFAVELDRRLRSRGVRTAAVHPGAVVTDMARHVTPAMLADLRSRSPIRPRKSVAAGAATQVWAAVVADPDAVGGRYCEDCHVAPVVEHVGVEGGVLARVQDPLRTVALWELSEALVGESFRH